MSETAATTGLICLGASAGGLRSLEAIVARLPADLPWPVLIAQHLQTDRVSQMPGILARVAHMPVREAADGETPLPGTIYTSPGPQEMGLGIDGRIALRAATPGRPQRIDHLFATASYARPGRTIAVVLSGTGSDGAAGSLVVKLNHGTVIAESEESAQHGAMPAAAQRAGTVDATLPADGIAALLDDLSRGSLEAATSGDMLLVADIARRITLPGGTDFTHYRATTLRRQAENRRAILGLRTLTEYRDHLAATPREGDALVKSLLIPVSEFFRDAAAWRALEDEIVPILAQKARAGEPVRIWCAGCATGEEAFTMAILLAESIAPAERAHVQILATDLDGASIARANGATFDASRMERVDALRRERFFESTDRGFRAADELRRMIEFRVHDVTRDEPPGEFDVVVCRNVLIYFDDALQARTLAKLQSALGGPKVLFLGRSEAFGAAEGGLVPVGRNLRIFRARDGTAATVAPRAPEDERAPGAAAQGMWSDASGVRVEEPDALVLVVDDGWRIVSANEHARGIIDGELLGTNLFDLFPRWQGSPVQDALRACAATGRSLKVRGAPAPHGPMDVTLERAPGAHRQTLLIGTPAQTHPRPGMRLAQEAREDLASTNDELQTANEELAATNEELQATNEELASLNEEYQSTNQTLASSNVELDSVAKSAGLAAELMDEFLRSRQDAMIAFDAAGRTTFFNRRAAALFGLDRSCIGRPVSSLGLAAASEVDAWFDHAPPSHGTTMHHAGRNLPVTIERLTRDDGSPLGWVVTWRVAGGT